MAKKLNVKKTTASELIEKWETPVPANWYGELLFIRCNSKGEINWSNSLVYSAEELIERDNVTIK